MVYFLTRINYFFPIIEDHAISTYAAAVLFRLSEDKPTNGVLHGGGSEHYGSNINYGMNNDPNLIYAGGNPRLNAGSNDQYVSFGNAGVNRNNNQDPYEMNPYDQKGGMQQGQSPATWFDTDL